MKVIYYMRRFRQIPVIEKMLLAKGILSCLILVPLVSLLPLKSYLKLMNRRPRRGMHSYGKKSTVRLALLTMRRIERFSPFRFSCLVKSITFKQLLNSLGIESNIALGVNNSHPGLLKAHAFVKVDNEIVYLKRKRFSEVYTIE